MHETLSGNEGPPHATYRGEPIGTQVPQAHISLHTPYDYHCRIQRSTWYSLKLRPYLAGYRDGSRVFVFRLRVACRASFRYGSDSLTRQLAPQQAQKTAFNASLQVDPRQHES